MDLKIFHDTVRYFINKEQGGWIAPEEIDNLCDRSQMWWYATCLPIYGKNQKSTDPLSPFSVTMNFVTEPDGIIKLPTDPAVNPCYETLPVVSISYFDSVANKIRYKPVKLLSEDEITERRGSQILEPTIYDPVGQEMAGGKIQLYPQTVLSGYCSYLKRPLKPVFNYTQSGRVITYNQGNSVQLEWPETSMNKILIKTIQMAGVNLSDEMIIQYTELKNSQDI